MQLFVDLDLLISKSLGAFLHENVEIFMVPKKNKSLLFGEAGSNTNPV